MIHLSDPTHGWIDITFGAGPDSYTLIASDVPDDCLRDLAAATSLLLAGAIEEKVEFSMEPGFTICHLQRASDLLHIRLTPPDRSAPVFESTFLLMDFAAALKSELLRIEPRYSHEAGWTQPFPHREVANLAGPASGGHNSGHTSNH
jgi:hypothetical protein